MLIVYIQRLLRVDSSILAGVFLTSFFCVVPESPYSSDAASSSLLVAWYSNCFSATGSTISLRNWWLHRSLCCGVNCQTNLCCSYSPSTCCCNNVLRLNAICAATFVVTLYREFFGEPNSSPHEVSGGFISPKPP